MTALIYTLGVFALILILARMKVPLAVSVLLGAAAAWLLFEMPADKLGRVLLAGVLEPRTIVLVIVVALLLCVSGAMQAGGQMERIVSLAKALFRRPAVTMAALPAMIGLLPMPGGALFSAPMVASVADGGKIAGARLSAVNYWFRHIWESFWPLYPGVITALALTKQDVGWFVAAQFPLCVCMVAGGMLILRGLGADMHVAAGSAPRGTKRKLIAGTSSIWLILLIWAAGRVALRFVPLDRLTPALSEEIGKYLPLVAGLLVSLFWTIRFNRLSASQVSKVLASRRIWSIVPLVVSVMIFQHTLGEVDAAGQIGQGLATTHVPAVVVMAALPFVAGLVTGLAVGFVGTSFPIVLALIPEGCSVYPYVVLAYGFGHMGQMLSPLHVCHVVSNRFFGAAYGPVYRRLVPAAAVFSVLAAGYVVALKMFLG